MLGSCSLFNLCRLELIGALQLADHRRGGSIGTPAARVRRGLHLRIAHGFLRELTSSSGLTAVDLENLDKCKTQIQWLESSQEETVEEETGEEETTEDDPCIEPESLVVV